MSSWPVTAWAAPGARRAAASTSPGRMSVLEGMQPQYEHSPPTSSRSTRATVRPPSARRPAACSPAGPAPTTTTSYEPVTWATSFIRVAAYGAVAGEVPAAVNVLRPPGLCGQGLDDHSDDHVVSNEGYRVRPPSTKSVWPVM